MSTVGFYTDAGEQTNVSASVAAAEAAATASATSASDSATSEANALSYSNNASTSASNAGTSETNASASETGAAMSATDSANSAIASAASAVDASVSEGNALTSENAAAASAAAALTSENNAAATLTNALTKSNNLSDVSDISVSRTNLNVYSKEETDSGRKNYLINGNLNTTIVNQRGFAGGQPAAGVYGYDRWKGDTLGTRIEQVVENTEVINETFTISWIGGTGTADVDGITGLNSGDSFTLNTSTNFSVIIPTDATYVQLEKGSVATPFEYRPIGEELALCQRYYSKGSFYELLGVANGDIVGFRYTYIEFPVTMRAIPSVSSTSSQSLNPAQTAVTVEGMGVGRSDIVASSLNSGTWTADSEP
jgi:hypothetical protein